MYDESDESGETEYMKQGWDNNVKNCNIPVRRSVMISDDQYSPEYNLLDTGVILGELGFAKDEYAMKGCGKWWCLEFKDEETALAFKLKWL